MLGMSNWVRGSTLKEARHYSSLVAVAIPYIFVEKGSLEKNETRTNVTFYDISN